MVDSHADFTVLLELDKNHNENTNPTQIVRTFQLGQNHSDDLFVQIQHLEVLPWRTAALGLQLGCHCAAARGGFLVKYAILVLKFEV